MPNTILTRAQKGSPKNNPDLPESYLYLESSRVLKSYLLFAVSCVWNMKAFKWEQTY